MNQKEPRRSVAEYLYKRVADHIAGRIEHGELRPGDQLLSERKLAEQWGTSHVTVPRAIRELRDQQRVITVPGVGTFVLVEPISEGTINRD